MSATPAGGIDPYATFDAAYVLGALSPEDRAAFEQHLGECEHCARSVRELAGLPGLLARAEHAGTGENAAPPGELLPSLMSRARSLRRRRVAGMVAAAGAAVAACLALVLVLLLPADPAAPARTEMTPLGDYPVLASANLAGQPWGTEVDVSCRYLGGARGDYVLIAVTDAGAVDELARWTAIPDDTTHLTVGTAFARTDIRTLEIRTATGTPLLRLTP